MGAQRILQAALILGFSGAALAAPKLHERVALIDLGPDDGTRKELLATIVASGFDPAVGDGIEDALAGVAMDKDAVALATAMADAQRAFGAFDCVAVKASAKTAIEIAAQRQAAGRPVPELPRALTYMLLCLDKLGESDAAMQHARWLRTVGGSPDVPPDVWKKYPDVDAMLGDERIAVEIEADVPDAQVFVDFKPAGQAPAKLHLSAGEHLIAVAAGTRRGWARGTAIPAQPKVTLPTQDYAGAKSALAAKVASWRGAKPKAEDIGWVMNETHARIVLVRSGDSLEAWGRVGRAEQPHVLGGEDGFAKVSDAEDTKRLMSLVTDRVQAWNDRAPDPDRPLLVEQPGDREKQKPRDEKAKWWVYAALAGAVLGASAVIYASEVGSDRQRVELKFP
jgi:hypothetical protein